MLDKQDADSSKNRYEKEEINDGREWERRQKRSKTEGNTKKGRRVKKSKELSFSNFRINSLKKYDKIL